MQGEPRDDDIKGFLFEGKLLSIPQLKAHVRESSCLARLLRNRQWRFSQIDPHHLAPGFCKGQCDKARTGGDIQDAGLRPGTHSLDETHELGPVGDQGICCICRCLASKLATNNCFVIRRG